MNSKAPVCRSDQLIDGGQGVRFAVLRNGREEPAFAVRHQGRVRAYLNQCAHVPSELDWNEGEFFDAGGHYLICGTHGAIYSPETGQCLGGRCDGKGLKAVAVEERDGYVFLLE